MTAQQRHLLIRADANSEVGHGHVMRCLALAQAWQGLGGTVSFACRTLPQFVADRLAVNGIEWARQPEPFESARDVGAFLELAQLQQADALVVDGYHFDFHWQSTANSADLPMLVIDDYGHLDRYDGGLLLNQNPGNHAELYQGKFDGRVLNGTRFALSHREFIELQNRIGEEKTRLHLLVTLGGSDAGDITMRVLQAVETFVGDELDVTFVSPIAGLSGNNPRITIIPHVEDMPTLMARTDIAICGGGSTNWELSLFGIPRLVIVLAPNQQRIARELAASGACHNLGWHGDVTVDQISSALDQLLHNASLRQSMADASRQLVDGQGAKRVCQELSSWK